MYLKICDNIGVAIFLHIYLSQNYQSYAIPNLNLNAPCDVVNKSYHCKEWVWPTLKISSQVSRALILIKYLQSQYNTKFTNGQHATSALCTAGQSESVARRLCAWPCELFLEKHINFINKLLNACKMAHLTFLDLSGVLPSDIMIAYLVDSSQCSTIVFIIVTLHQAEKAQ